MKPKTIAQGAEAKIILNSSSSGGRVGTQNQFIIKDRISKSYRISEIDKRIRKRRTKAEAKLLNKASEIINVPIPFFEPTKGFYKIKMPYIKGKKLSEHLDKFPLNKQKQICKQIGQDISKLHNVDIIHGDLTTSNMILVENPKDLPAHSRSQINDSVPASRQGTSLKKSVNPINNSSAKHCASSQCGAINRASAPIVFFIDFGLGYFNGKYEDKAVDLHLLKQALEAKHYKNWETLWKSVEAGYKKNKDSKIVLERLKAVERRGRYKH